MRFADLSKSVRDAIDRVAKKNGKTREQVMSAYDKAARGESVNAISLFLD